MHFWEILGGKELYNIDPKRGQIFVWHDAGLFATKHYRLLFVKPHIFWLGPSRTFSCNQIQLSLLRVHFKLSLASNHHFSQASPRLLRPKTQQCNTYGNLLHTKTTVPAQHSITALRLQRHWEKKNITKSPPCLRRATVCRALGAGLALFRQISLTF